MDVLSKPMTNNQVPEVLTQVMGFSQEIKVVEMDKLVTQSKV